MPPPRSLLTSLLFPFFSPAVVNVLLSSALTCGATGSEKQGSGRGDHLLMTPNCVHSRSATDAANRGRLRHLSFPLALALSLASLPEAPGTATKEARSCPYFTRRPGPRRDIPEIGKASILPTRAQALLPSARSICCIPSFSLSTAFPKKPPRCACGRRQPAETREA